MDGEIDSPASVLNYDRTEKVDPPLLYKKYEKVEDFVTYLLITWFALC